MGQAIMCRVPSPIFRLFRVLAPFIALSGYCQMAPEETFWKWFQKNNDVLFDFEQDRDKVFDRLSTEMHKVDADLTFEFGPKKDGRREFVISADGIRSAFPKVETLFATAPKLPHWTFIKFRPRRPPSDINYEGVSVKSTAVLAHLELRGKKADVTLFIPGYTLRAKPAYTAIAFLLLDQALGEYDVETRVGEVTVKPTTLVSHDANSFASLPDLFDRLFLPR
jgi:hypothetical protein